MKEKDSEKDLENIYFANIAFPKQKNLEIEFRLKEKENEFRLIEKENDNIFTIDLFENMLKEINIAQSLIDVIGNYLRQKSQKNFLSYELFEEVLSLLKIPFKNNEIEKFDKNEILNGLFKIFSYPNNYITKTAFLFL